MRYSRRDILVGTALLFSPGIASAGADDRILEIENGLGGRIGVSALNTANGVRIRHRSDERFAMCSTFKAALVGMVVVQSCTVTFERAGVWFSAPSRNT